MEPVLVAACTRRKRGAAGDAAEDEALAARCSATTLITASAASDVERLARRIHAASPRAEHPFVHVPAAALPAEPDALPAACTRLLAAASGGTLLLTDVEDMPAIVQNQLIETIARLQDAGHLVNTVRLMAGTTASLLDRIADGTFLERLFYRLNIVHINTRSSAPES
jgi:DNA-binding NtrC family response regulator